MAPGLISIHRPPRKSSTSASWSRRSPRAASQSAPSGRRPTSPPTCTPPLRRPPPRTDPIGRERLAHRSTGYTADSDVDLLVEFDPDHVPSPPGHCAWNGNSYGFHDVEGFGFCKAQSRTRYWGQGFSYARQMVPQCCRSTSFGTRFQLVLGNSERVGGHHGPVTEPSAPAPLTVDTQP